LYANQDNGTHIRKSAASYAEFIGGDGTSCKFDKSDKSIYYGTVQNGEFMRRVVEAVVTDITPQWSSKLNQWHSSYQMATSYSLADLLIIPNA